MAHICSFHDYEIWLTYRPPLLIHKYTPAHIHAYYHQYYRRCRRCHRQHSTHIRTIEHMGQSCHALDYNALGCIHRSHSIRFWWWTSNISHATEKLNPTIGNSNMFPAACERHQWTKSINGTDKRYIWLITCTVRLHDSSVHNYVRLNVFAF